MYGASTEWKPFPMNERQLTAIDRSKADRLLPTQNARPLSVFDLARGQQPALNDTAPGK